MNKLAAQDQLKQSIVCDSLRYWGAETEFKDAKKKAEMVGN